MSAPPIGSNGVVCLVQERTVSINEHSICISLAIFNRYCPHLRVWLAIRILLVDGMPRALERPEI